MTDEYEKFKIKEYKHWIVYLHDKYYAGYLGSMYIWAKREGDRDIIDMTKEEKEEFFNIGRKVKKALKELFNPGRFNYAALQNVSHHLHVHVVPRYESPRMFAGREFVDEEWGGPLKEPAFNIPEETVLKIRNAIRNKLMVIG